MKFQVPVSVNIEAPTREKAMESARAIQRLLNEPMVTTVLSSNGIQVDKIVVYEPKST